LVNADAYERGLNFVFGLAMPGLGVGAVFLPRLRNEFYGWEPNEELYMERVEKEVLHELGHLLGLEHCPNPRCVMSFSNSIYDVDRKEARFCERCKAELRKRLSA
jgi:archaemetzincin